ncbi:MAG: family 1 encapsulin nanocompartment shell protein [Planctomycetota bacterium]
MNDLRRELAPICAEAWSEIDEEAKNTLKPLLAARKFVDFEGPLGWEAASVTLGRTEKLGKGPREKVAASLRRVQPLVELRVPFELDRDELDAIARGAKDADLDPVREAARAIGMAEDQAIFHGFSAAGIQGICEASAQGTLNIPDRFVEYPGVVAQAVAKLRMEGVGGPYAIALGPQCYTGLTETTEGGFPVIQHVQKLLDGPVIWAPAVDGAVVVSLRGGDFELTVGRDFSIGYQSHTDAKVALYLEESFTFRALAPEAAIPLAYAKKRAGKK